MNEKEPRTGPDGLEMLDGEGKPVEFYYSRKHRLKRASRAVREMNEPGAPRRPRFRNISLLFMLILMGLCALVFVITRLYL
ncbi:MAG: hypothetical protein LBJ31_10455 [Treponema sp.]|jgi:hypothetical protein|nr:hypothetical protein [Treponema sp.]